MAAEYLRKRHRLTVSKETLRQWMAKAGLWRAGHRRMVEVHDWRPRRSTRRVGAMGHLQSRLAGRSRRAAVSDSMIDDASSELLARFVRTTPLWRTAAAGGVPRARPAAGLLHRQSEAVPDHRQDGATRRVKKSTGGDAANTDRRALRELAIVWIPAHSPQAKGRVERQFLTAQDRLVKGLRVAGAGTLERPMRIWSRSFCRGGISL